MLCSAIPGTVFIACSKCLLPVLRTPKMWFKIKKLGINYYYLLLLEIKNCFKNCPHLGYKKVNFQPEKSFNFFYVVPSSEETSFWPLSMVYISVIIYTYYTLQIMLDLLCGQLYMYCTLDTSSLGIWVLLMMQFLSSVVF